VALGLVSVVANGRLPMRLLLYEWSCSGGLECPEASCLLPMASEARRSAIDVIQREGRLMFTAAARDLLRADGLEVTGLVAATRPFPLPAGIRRCSVPTGAELPLLEEESRKADVTLLVAPETAGILATRVAAARAAGGRVVAPGARFLAAASDKHRTVLALAAAGVPVPAGRRLEARMPWPKGFHLPAVRKAHDGVGCDELSFIRPGDPTPPPCPRPSRVESFAAGIPVGVSCLTGPDGIAVLPPMRQRFGDRREPKFLGGIPLSLSPLVDRAAALARRSIDALVRATAEPGAEREALQGWVGVDMVLGEREDGRADRVLEINPRLTSSFLGLSIGPGSLIRRLLDIACGITGPVADLPAAPFFVADEADP
jgi:predicted ATP-grasp superfamily ATP-dependent carboligase